jgi:hypothetical protein
MSLTYTPRQTVVNGSGRPYAGARAWFYRAGTTTAQTVYTDAARATPHANPVVANAAGRFPIIYLDPANDYRCIVKDSGGNTLFDDDAIPSDVTVTRSGVGTVLHPTTAAELAADITPTDYAYPPGDVRRYGADATGVSDSYAAFQSALDIGGTVTVPDGHYKISATLTPSATSSVIGSCAANTMIEFTANVHGFTFPRESTNRRKKVFSGFTITNSGSSTAKYAFYFPGTDSSVDDLTYCLGYAFKDIEINTDFAHFAGGFRFKDCFRTEINNVGMTGGARGLRLDGQVVQFDCVKFVANADATNDQFGSADADNMGLAVLPSTDYYDSTSHVAEGVRILNSSFVFYRRGFSGGGLNVLVNGCEFDLYAGGVGANLVGYSGGLVFQNNWVSPVSGNEEDGLTGTGPIGILTTSATAQPEHIKIDGNYVFAAGTLPSGGVGIVVGNGGVSPYTESEGPVVTNNLIKSGTTGTSRWTIGIQLDRNKSVRVENNTVYGESASCCETAAINASNVKHAMIVGNHCKAGTILLSCVDADGFGEVTGNYCTTFTDSSAGHTVGNWLIERNLTL